jgi:hypothetical protein
MALRKRLVALLTALVVAMSLTFSGAAVATDTTVAGGGDHYGDKDGDKDHYGDKDDDCDKDVYGAHYGDKDGDKDDDCDKDGDKDKDGNKDKDGKKKHKKGKKKHKKGKKKKSVCVKHFTKKKTNPYNFLWLPKNAGLKHKENHGDKIFWEVKSKEACKAKDKTPR